MTDQRDETGGQQNAISRRDLLKHIAYGGLAFSGVGGLLSACAPRTEEEAPSDRQAPSYELPTNEGRWTPPASHVGDVPAGEGSVHVQNVGDFVFHAEDVETKRPDIFQPGHFSLFDLLVHLADRGEFRLSYHFDETMDTHVVESLNGESGWWHNAHYSAGWFESNVFRMDMYPYKNNTRLRLEKEGDARVERIYQSFRQEVERLERNGGRVIIPEVMVRSPDGRRSFDDVLVTPHDVREDVLQAGVVTGLDALLSLAEQGELAELKLTWYERIAGAEPVDSFWVERIDGAVATGGCGFVYESGPRQFAGFSGTHIHIPADVRVTISPEYALWFWICLGRGGL